MSENIKQNEINRMLKNFVEISDSKKLPQFCVDGRKGTKQGLYLQSLGGSYHAITLNWLLAGGKADQYKDIQEETLTTLKNKGYRLSVHEGSHVHDDASDCGFADNNGKIIKKLGENGDQIWEMITQVEPELRNDSETWIEIIDLINKAEVDQIPSGKDLITQVKDRYQADFQTLEGEHGEIAAVVNLKENTTLNVDQNQDTQAFNLDLWFVMQQAKDLGLDEKKALLLSLGLYVATEMVLVEDKGKSRLPIVVRK